MRKKDEVRFLENAFKNNPFFLKMQSTLNPKQYKMLYQNISYEKYHKYENIIKYGTIGMKYFIILNGSIIVMIPKVKELETNPFAELEVESKCHIDGALDKCNLDQLFDSIQKFDDNEECCEKKEKKDEEVQKEKEEEV